MHPNEKLIRSAYDAFVTGDLDAVRRAVHPDAVWHVAGSSPLAGVYKGHDEILSLFGRIFELTAGTISVSARDVLAGDDHVIVLTTMKAERGGEVLDDDGVAVFKLAQGKAIEVWNFAENQAAMDAFFSTASG